MAKGTKRARVRGHYITSFSSSARTMQYGGGLTVEGRRDAAFAINEPFVLIEGTILPNLKSRHRRCALVRERIRFVETRTITFVS